MELYLFVTLGDTGKQSQWQIGAVRLSVTERPQWTVQRNGGQRLLGTLLGTVLPPQEGTCRLTDSGPELIS